MTPAFTIKETREPGKAEKQALNHELDLTRRRFALHLVNDQKRLERVLRVIGQDLATLCTDSFDIAVKDDLFIVDGLHTSSAPEAEQQHKDDFKTIRNNQSWLWKGRNSTGAQRVHLRPLKRT